MNKKKKLEQRQHNYHKDDIDEKDFTQSHPIRTNLLQSVSSQGEGFQDLQTQERMVTMQANMKRMLLRESSDSNRISSNQRGQGSNKGKSPKQRGTRQSVEGNPSQNDLQNKFTLDSEDLADRSILQDEDNEPDNFQLSEDEEDPINPDEEKKTRSTAQIVYRLMNSGLQAGVLFLPYFFSTFGLLPALFIMLSTFFLSILSSIILLKCKNLSRRSNYSTIAFESLGEGGELAAKLLIVLNRLGYLVILVALIADCASQLTCASKAKAGAPQCTPSSYFARQPFISLAIGIAVAPIALLPAKNPKTLIAPILRAMAVSLLALQILITFALSASKKNYNQQVALFAPNFDFATAFSALPVIVLVFNYHHKFFRFFKRLRDPCDKKMVIATVYGNSLVALVYGGIGILGYITFTTQLSTNNNQLPYLLLNNFIASTPDGEVNSVPNYLDYIYYAYFSNPIFCSVVLSFFAIVFMVQLPSIFYEAKFQVFCIRELIIKRNQVVRLPSNASPEEQRERIRLGVALAEDANGLRFVIPQQRRWSYFILYTTFWVAITIIAYFTKQPLAACCIVGALSANSLSFLLPGLFYVRLVPYRSSLYFGAWLLIILSIALTFSSLLALIFLLLPLQ